MRELSLHEKISIKGRLDKKGVTGLAGSSLGHLMFLWDMCYGITIAKWHIVPTILVGKKRISLPRNRG